MSFSPKRSDLERFFGARALPAWIDAMSELAPVLCEHYEFDRRRWVHFCGPVIGAETDGLALSPMEENMNYRAPRIIEVFDYRLGLALKQPQWRSYGSKRALASYLAGKPNELAAVVYGGREGSPPGDGRFRGRGPTQTTHLNNYRDAGAEVARQPGGGKFDLVAHPEQLAHDPELGIRVAFAEWHLKNLNRWADADDLENVSSVLNTGQPGKWSITNGRDNRKRWHAKAISVWPDDGVYEMAKAEVGVLAVGSKGDKVTELQELLREKNYFAGNVDGSFGSLTEDAVILFQKDHGLLRDGKVGALTLATLEKAPPKDLGERDQITEKELAARGSQTIAKASLGKRVFKWLGWGGTGGAGAKKLDETFDLGGVDFAISQGEKVKSLAGRSVDLAAWIPPSGILWIMGVGAFGLACYGVYWLFDRIVEQRVKDAQSGAHRGR